MATHTELRPTRSAGTSLRNFGLFGLIVGLIGVLVWAGVALVASGHGTVGEDSVVFDVAQVGADDPMDNPGVWTGWDESGRVVWQGTEDEWRTITTEDRASYQAELRATWLYPSVVVAACGLFIYLLGHRREADDRRPTLAASGRLRR